MKVAVLFSAAPKESLRSVLAEFARLGIPASAYRIPPGWERISEGWLGERLVDATHGVLVPAPEELEASWTAFAAGFFTGRGARPYLCLSAAAGCTPGGYLELFPAGQSPEELGGYFSGIFREWAAASRQETARERIIASGASLTEEAFARAVSEGDTVLAEDFFTLGFSPDTRDEKGVPLLSLAARGRHRSLITLFVDRGADIDAMSGDRRTTALMDAVSAMDEKAAAVLIERGADLNVQSRDGQTALMIAIGQGAVSMAELLIGSGADADVKDKLGMNAVGYARLFRHERIALQLGQGATEGGSNEQEAADQGNG